MFSSTKTQFSTQNSIHSADSLTTLDHQKEKCYANRATLPCTYEQQIFQSIHLHKENPWYCFMRSGWVALKHVSHLRLLSLPAGKKVDCTFRHFSFYIRTWTWSIQQPQCLRKASIAINAGILYCNRIYWYYNTGILLCFMEFSD